MQNIKMLNATSHITKALIPPQAFLHRIFPSAHYTNNADEIVDLRIFKPRNDSTALSLDFPLNWEAESHIADRNWRMQLQGWAFFHPIMNFFDEYHDKPKVLEFFLAAARDWWGNYKTDPDDMTTSRMPKSYAWYDMSVGFRALVIAYFLNRIECHKIKISDEDREFLNTLALKHINNLSNSKTFSLNNHGLFQIQGLMALISSTPMQPEEFIKLQCYGLEQMERLVVSQYDVSGIHLEHSPHYHFYATDVFEAIVSTGWYANCNVIMERLIKAKEAKKWIVDPYRRPVCVGDSILTEQHSVVFPTELEVQHSGSGAHYVTSTFNSSGYAVVRSNWNTPAENASMLFVTGMYHSTAHKHRDCLSFEWFDHGDKIICDSGKYGYKSDKYRNYFLSSRAHNSVEIEGFDIIKLKPYGSAIREVVDVGNDIYRITCSLDFPAIKHTRNFYFKPGRWVIIVDELAFAKARNFTQWFHLDKDFQPNRIVGSSLRLTGNKSRTLYIDCLADGATLATHRGDEELMQGFLCEKDYKFEPALAVGFKFFGATKKLTTTLALGPDERIEALNYASSSFGENVNEILAEHKDKASSNLIPHIPHSTLPPVAELKLPLGEGTYRVKIGGIDFNFYANIKKSDKLIVLLPGATNRDKGCLDFQRYSWSSDFECSVLAFSDPTITPDNDLSIAWFQGRAQAYGIEALSTLLKNICTDSNYSQENVILFGSSGGGFTGLKLANDFPASVVIAINPQIYLYNYSKLHFDKMLAFCYEGMSYQDVMRAYKDRLVVNLNEQVRKAPAYVFQNIYDEKHLNLHIKHFLKNMPTSVFSETHITEPLDADKMLHVVYFEDAEAGHTPPNRAQTLSIIRSIADVINF